MMTVLRNKLVMATIVTLVLLVVGAFLIPAEHLDNVGTAILVAMLLPANYFPIFYTIAFRWWGGHLGRSLFIKAFGLAIVLDTAMYVKFFGTEGEADEIRFVAYSIVLVGMTYQSIVMTRIRISPPPARDGSERQADLKGVDRTHPEHLDTL